MTVERIPVVFVSLDVLIWDNLEEILGSDGKEERNNMRHRAD